MLFSSVHQEDRRTEYAKIQRVPQQRSRLDLAFQEVNVFCPSEELNAISVSQARYVGVRCAILEQCDHNPTSYIYQCGRHSSRGPQLFRTPPLMAFYNYTVLTLFRGVITRRARKFALQRLTSSSSQEPVCGQTSKLLFRANLYKNTLDFLYLTLFQVRDHMALEQCWIILYIVLIGEIAYPFMNILIQIPRPLHNLIASGTPTHTCKFEY